MLILSMVMFFLLAHNGYVYETFGISKHFPVKLQLLLIRAGTFDNKLTAKCFIYDVGISLFIHLLLLLNQFYKFLKDDSQLQLIILIVVQKLFLSINLAEQYKF